MAEEEAPSRTRIEAIERIVFPVMGAGLAYMLLSLLVGACWNAVAHDFHLPLLTVGGSLGLVGLILMLFGLAVTAYTVAVRDWGD